VILARLALTFGLLSVFSFGGGGAIVPQMHADVVERLHWIDAEQFSRFVGLAMLAPGPLLNMVVLIGYAVAGIPGAIVASAALFWPAALIVFFVGRAWHGLAGHPWRETFARGLAPVVLGLFWAGIFAIGNGGITDPITIAIALAVGAAALFTNVNQALLVVGAGIVAVVALR
jgi:chromate transporter